MNPLEIQRPDGRPPTYLFLGAHCDDIEIGCGGTILGLREARPEAEVHWVVFSSTEERRRETLEGARRLLGEEHLPSVRIEAFRDGYLPHQGAEVKDCFEAIKRTISPDVIFTHYRHDLHQDHRLVNELTWNTWRDHLILEYEIPKWDGDLGQPNVFVPISAAHVEQKVKLVLEVYPSQAAKEWLDADTLKAIMRLRGVESNAPDRHAEAFYARKLVLAP